MGRKTKLRSVVCTDEKYTLALKMAERGCGGMFSRYVNKLIDEDIEANYNNSFTTKHEIHHI